ncbi:hypothetical protein PTI98_003772 [Pleurotus ostreatus]|nr:hypothetical protein PTI98_003772 [Pleurotus ostreatus]
MTNWNSPDVIASNGVSFSRLVHAFVGLYIWEWFLFLDVDWMYVKIIKRYPLSPMMFYFMNRYCLLAALISVVIALNVESEINCQPLYAFMNLLGNIALELASITAL